MEQWTRSHVIGGPATVRAALEHLVERTCVDELMVTTMVHSHAERVDSYGRLASVMRVDPVGAAATAAGVHNVDTVFVAGRAVKLVGARLTDGDDEPTAVDRAKSVVASIASRPDQ